MSDELSPDDYLGCQWIARSELSPNQYNPNSIDEREAELLRKSICNNGWTAPIIVREDMTIVDGEQRWTVADSDDIQSDDSLTPPDVPAGHVPVLPLEFTDDDARIATIQHNRAHGEVQIEDMEDYVEQFDAAGLADIGLTDSEIYDVIDANPLDDVDVDDDLGDPTVDDVDEVVSDDETDPPLPVPSPDSVSVVCSNREARLIQAVFHDGETIEEYVEYLVDSGLIHNFRRLLDDD